MPRKQRLADPGGERTGPPGTVLWAQRLRLDLQGAVRSLAAEPKAVARMIESGNKFNAWAMLNKKDGSLFRSFDEFCEYEYPWGLARPFREIQPYLDALYGRKQSGQIEAEAAAGAGSIRGPGRPTKGEEKGSDTTFNGERGRTYLARRLARDNPELLERVKAGDLSIHAAAKLAGIVKRPSVDAVIRRIRREYSPDERAEIARLVCADE